MILSIVSMIDGQEIDLLDDNMRAPSLKVIALSLSRQARFTGHTNRVYSVAHHSLLVRHLCVDDTCKFEALGHDFCEVILGDISTPVKAVGGTALAVLEERCQRAICRDFGMIYPFPQAVCDADQLALVAEWLTLRPDVSQPPSLPDHLADQLREARRQVNVLSTMNQLSVRIALEQLARQDHAERQRIA